MMTAIKTIGLEHIYTDGTNALAGVNFEARESEKVAVLGPNGSGKTTLFYHFNGLVEPTRGEVQVFGEKISKTNIDKIRKRVGLIFQESDSQLFAPTVFEDIAFGPKNLRLPPLEIEKRVSHVLQRFDIENLAKKESGELKLRPEKKGSHCWCRCHGA